MERLTKLTVIASNLLALWLLARLVSRGVPPILIPTAVTFVASAAAAVIFGELATSAILSLIYFVPVMFFAWFGNFSFSYNAIWLAGLCGSMIPASARSKWAFPTRWKPPLVFWALALSLSWPLVVLREVDFVPALLNTGNLWNSRLGASPPTVVVWILSVTSIATTGLLLFDWLYLTFPGHQSQTLLRFERRIVWPMFAGACTAAAVAVYQSLVRMSFLNHTLFETLGRAVGTMRDANAFGTIAALWLPLAAALTLGRERSRRAAAAGFLLFLCLGIGVWASGSRTALLTALVGLAVLIGAIWRSLGARQLVIGFAGAAAMIAALSILMPASTTGPLARLTNFVTTPETPSLSLDGAMFTLHHLWTRGMYGTAAVRIIREHPLVGIGAGGFNYQYADALYLIDGSVLPPDNAQNWFRQQLTELGVLGSAGWIAWTGMFLWVLARGRGSDANRATIGAVKGAIIGVGIASLIGMPTLDLAPSITFIVLACWCLKLTGADDPTPQDRGTQSRLQWFVVLAVLICFLSGTAFAAWTDLRPPHRALRADFPYQYGFSAPDPQNPEFRWTDRKAVDVFHADKRWMKIVIGAVAPDAAERPVQVKVWFNDQLILQVERQGNFPITRYIRMPKYLTPVMIQIETSRTWRPSDFGQSDDGRARGVAVGKWVFTDEDPAKGSLTVE